MARGAKYTRSSGCLLPWPKPSHVSISAAVIPDPCHYFTIVLRYDADAGNGFFEQECCRVTFLEERELLACGEPGCSSY